MTATVAALVRDRARQTPDKVAVRSKRLGIWHEVTWAQHWRDVERAAQVLLGLNVEPGDRVAIVSENRYEWVVLDAAIVAVRGVTVGLDPTIGAADVQAALSSARATVVVAENSEQVDKVLAVADRLPGLAHLLYVDGRGVPAMPDESGWNHVYDDPRLRPWPSAPGQATDGVDQRMEAAEPADAVTVLPPAPMLVSADDAAHWVEAVAQDITPPPSDADLVLPLVSLAEGTARVFSSWLSAATGVQLHLAESVSTLRRDFREVQPTVQFAPAHVWERLAADIEQRMTSATHLKRWAWRTWRPRVRASASEPAGGDPRVRASASEPAGGDPAGEPSAIGRLVVYRPLRDRVGLRCLRHAAYTGTVGSEVLSFFAAVGVPLSQGSGAPWNG